VPIDIDRFEEADTLQSAATSERILEFLRRNDDQAFTRSEIAEGIDADPETVGTNLTRLKERSRVRHRSPYWAPLPEDGQPEGGSGRTDQRPSADDSAASDTPHERAADEFVRTVETDLRESVEAVYVFGSVARGTERETSDVDVLVVASDDVEFASVDDRLLAIAYDVQLSHGVPVEVHSMGADEFHEREERGDPFVRTILEEGVRRV